MFNKYYQLTKPGIIYGNLLTATAGFLLASKGHVDFGLLIETLVGISLVIASACAFNNYIDRDIDRHMARTNKRALVEGSISGRAAITFASVIGIIGVVVLSVFTNPLVVIIGLVAFVDYVVLYGLSKRKSVHGTLVGSISGAAPIVAGYCAVTNRFDTGAIILFLILVFWQMPHFYSIAIYRLKDYKSAKIPVLPAVKGVKTTKIQIILYILAFIVAIVLLKTYGYADYGYLIVMLMLSLVWLVLGLSGFKTQNSKLWARRMFLFSLVIILALSVVLSISSFA